MAENSQVKEGQCDEHRQHIYDEIKDVQKEVNIMKGGIKVLSWGGLAVFAALGFYINREFDSNRQALEKIRDHQVNQIHKSTGRPSVAADVPDERGAIDYQVERIDAPAMSK